MDTPIVVGFAVLMFLGAFFGWKAGSRVSLIMGIVTGLLVLFGWYLTLAAGQAGWIFLACVAGILTVMFCRRLLKTRSFMPSGMLLVVTLAFLLYTVLHLAKG